MDNCASEMSFPLKHYRGISVVLNLEAVAKNPPGTLAESGIDILQFKEKFCMDGTCFIMRAKDEIQNERLAEGLRHLTDRQRQVIELYFWKGYQSIEYRRTGKTRRYLPDAEYVWSAATITVLLQHKEYLGCTVNFKTYSKSYKLKKRHPTPENQQMVFENTHEAIITQEVWETVQRLHQHRRRSPKSEVPSLFSGILYCADCGAPLHFSSGNTTSGKDPRYICGSYRKRSVEKCCTAHYIRLAVLEELVLENLRQVVRFATDQEDEFAKLIMNRTLSKNDADLKLMQKEISAKEHRITELDKIIKKLYEDNFSGKLSDERYMIFSRDYENEQHTLRTEVDSLKLQIQEQDSKVVNINSFVEIAKKYTSFEKLTPGMLHELVEKIVVHEGDKSSGHRIQKIDIYYSFVGDLESSHVVAQRTLKNEVA